MVFTVTSSNCKVKIAWFYEYSWTRSIQPKFPEISVQNSMDRFGPTGKVSKKRVHLLRWTTFPGRTGWNFGWMDRAPCSLGESQSDKFFSVSQVSSLPRRSGWSHVYSQTSYGRLPWRRSKPRRNINIPKKALSNTRKGHYLLPVNTKTKMVSCQ